MSLCVSGLSALMLLSRLKCREDCPNRCHVRLTCAIGSCDWLHVMSYRAFLASLSSQHNLFSLYIGLYCFIFTALLMLLVYALALVLWIYPGYALEAEGKCPDWFRGSMGSVCLPGHLLPIL